METLLFGTLAFLALLGWGVTIAITARNQLREATALETLLKARKTIDDEQVAVANRVRQLYTTEREQQEDGKPIRPTADDNARRIEELRQRIDMAAFPDGISDPGGTTLPEMPVEE